MAARLAVLSRPITWTRPSAASAVSSIFRTATSSPKGAGADRAPDRAGHLRGDRRDMDEAARQRRPGCGIDAATVFGRSLHIAGMDRAALGAPSPSFDGGAAQGGSRSCHQQPQHLPRALLSASTRSTNAALSPPFRTPATTMCGRSRKPSLSGPLPMAMCCSSSTCLRGSPARSISEKPAIADQCAVPVRATTRRTSNGDQLLVANQQRFTGTVHTAILGIRKIYLARLACTKKTSAAVRFAQAAAVATIPASGLSHATDRSPR